MNPLSYHGQSTIAITLWVLVGVFDVAGGLQRPRSINDFFMDDFLMLLQETVVRHEAPSIRNPHIVDTSSRGGSDVLSTALAADDAMFNGSFEVTALGLLQIDAVKDVQSWQENETIDLAEAAAEEQPANSSAKQPRRPDVEGRPKELAAADQNLYSVGDPVNSTGAEESDADSTNVSSALIGSYVVGHERMYSPREKPEMVVDYSAPPMLVLGVVLLLLSLVVCALTAFCFGNHYSRPPQAKDPPNGMSAYVNSLTPCSTEWLHQQLEEAEAPIDCALSRPWSSRKAVRLEARVEGVAGGDGGALEAPLTKRSCVVYSSAVLQHTHDGMNPVSVAFAQNCVNFEVSLIDAPEMRVEVRGEDVLLFDLEAGHCTETSTFDAAPDHWQLFAMTRRGDMAGPSDAAALARRFGVQPLHFQEYALLVGAPVTLIGELHRRPDGRLQLQPRVRGGAEEKGKELWRTSWERTGCKDEAEKFTPYDKVLVSDRTNLLHSPRDAAADKLWL